MVHALAVVGAGVAVVAAQRGAVGKVGGAVGGAAGGAAAADVREGVVVFVLEQAPEVDGAVLVGVIGDVPVLAAKVVDLEGPGTLDLAVGIGVPVAADNDGRAVGQGRPVAADLLRAAVGVAGVGMDGDGGDGGLAVQDELDAEARKVVVAVGLAVGVVAAVGGLGAAFDVGEA